MSEVFDSYADMVARYRCVKTEDHVNAEDGKVVPDALSVAAEFSRHARSIGLIEGRMKAARVATFETRDGKLRTVKRLAAYVMPLATSDDPIESARALADHIHKRWGPGRVFVLARAGYLRGRGDENDRTPLFGPGHEEDTGTDAGFRTVVDPTSSERRMRMGVYYAHENMPSEEVAS